MVTNAFFGNKVRGQTCTIIAVTLLIWTLMAGGSAEVEVAAAESAL